MDRVLSEIIIDYDFSLEKFDLLFWRSPLPPLIREDKNEELQPCGFIIRKVKGRNNMFFIKPPS